jgi:hypothetical protein
VADVPRIAVTYAEAAAAMGLSESTFKRHVLPQLRVIRNGSTCVVPVVELQRYAERQATLAGGNGSA